MHTMITLAPTVNVFPIRRLLQKRSRRDSSVGESTGDLLGEESDELIKVNPLDANLQLLLLLRRHFLFHLLLLRFSSRDNLRFRLWILFRLGGWRGCWLRSRGSCGGRLGCGGFRLLNNMNPRRLDISNGRSSGLGVRGPGGDGRLLVDRVPPPRPLIGGGGDGQETLAEVCLLDGFQWCCFCRHPLLDGVHFSHSLLGSFKRVLPDEIKARAHTRPPRPLLPCARRPLDLPYCAIVRRSNGLEVFPLLLEPLHLLKHIILLGCLPRVRRAVR
mmetsp:Transcript_28171/g.65777  ORF Transcript_28171/g.65777 Transcript_28171/m.65777 type:complete len:273 (-) Transcript_28171:411-1229(-)